MDSMGRPDTSRAVPCEHCLYELAHWDGQVSRPVCQDDSPGSTKCTTCGVLNKECITVVGVLKVRGIALRTAITSAPFKFGLSAAEAAVLDADEALERKERHAIAAENLAATTERAATALEQLLKRYEYVHSDILNAWSSDESEVIKSGGGDGNSDSDSMSSGKRHKVQ